MADLTWEDVTILVDSREQCPLDFGSMTTQVVTLDLGDYSVRGLEHVVRVERKSLPDLVACCGRERDRFSREIERLRGYPCRAVVCECSWGELELGGWRSKISPQSVIGSIVGWMCTGVPFVLAGNRDRAAKIVARMLFLTARRRVRENKAIFQQVTADGLFEVATSKAVE